jgi:hypothetical protein
MYVCMYVCMYACVAPGYSINSYPCVCNHIWCQMHDHTQSGRGAGGRGVARITGETKDIHVNNVTMARGVTQLLTGATLKLVHGHRYGLVGMNGVGKTTLLRRMALGTLPGMPPWMTVLHVEQEMPECEDSAIDFVLRFDYERTRLLVSKCVRASVSRELEVPRPCSAHMHSGHGWGGVDHPSALFNTNLAAAYA